MRRPWRSPWKQNIRCGSTSHVRIPIFEALRKISGEIVTPLGFGAGIDDPGVFQGLLREGLIDVVRPDIAIFGISGVRRIVRSPSPITWQSLPATTVGRWPLPRHPSRGQHPEFFHTARAHPCVGTGSRDAERDRIAVARKSSGGFLELTKTPGLGITVNETALEKYRAS